MRQRVFPLVVAMGLLMAPLFAGARQAKGVHILLEGGQAWGSSLSGPLASAKVFLPLAGGIWLQGGYIHYFNPTVYERTPNKRSAFTLGLQYMSPERGQRLRWFAHCDGGSLRRNFWSEPDDFFREPIFGLGTGLEKPLSDRIGLRFNVRGWTTIFDAHTFFGDAWAETSLGLCFHLRGGSAKVHVPRA